jgi:hypothetical protein
LSKKKAERHKYAKKNEIGKPLPPVGHGVRLTPRHVCTLVLYDSKTKVIGWLAIFKRYRNTHCLAKVNKAAGVLEEDIASTAVRKMFNQATVAVDVGEKDGVSHNANTSLITFNFLSRPSRTSAAWAIKPL